MSIVFNPRRKESIANTNDVLLESMWIFAAACHDVVQVLLSNVMPAAAGAGEFIRVRTGLLRHDASRQMQNSPTDS